MAQSELLLALLERDFSRLSAHLTHYYHTNFEALSKRAGRTSTSLWPFCMEREKRLPPDQSLSTCTGERQIFWRELSHGLHDPIAQKAVACSGFLLQDSAAQSLNPASLSPVLRPRDQRPPTRCLSPERQRALLHLSEEHTDPQKADLPIATAECTHQRESDCQFASLARYFASRMCQQHTSCRERVALHPPLLITPFIDSFYPDERCRSSIIAPDVSQSTARTAF